MKNQKILSDKQAAFIDYLLTFVDDGKKRLPSIEQIGKELGVSTPNIREQMELARNFGLIQTQPRKGISILPYDFTPAVNKSLYIAIKTNLDYFQQFSVLRNKLEKSFFIEAASLLGEKETCALRETVEKAIDKLAGNPIQIPHLEHRTYHLMIYEKLENVFLKGLLNAYWDMYELVGLDRFNDLQYLKEVWKYHENIIDLIDQENYSEAYRLLEEHVELIYKRNPNE